MSKYWENMHDTEDKMHWIEESNVREKNFCLIMKKLGKNLIINPDKRAKPTEPDLLDVDTNNLAELKTIFTPIFTIPWLYPKHTFVPQYTATFDRPDYENYLSNYPGLQVYFFVRWDELQYIDKKGKYDPISVKPMLGIWLTSIEEIHREITNRKIPYRLKLIRKDGTNKIFDKDGNSKYNYPLDVRWFEELYYKGPEYKNSKILDLLKGK